MSNATVITEAQLQAMRAKVYQHEATPQQTERLRLKALSTQRTARWPNTLQARRDAKEQARRDRLAAEEAERVLIDEQDAEERTELRRRQIESANKMLYDDTDRPKALHSKMLLSDVMHERVAQMDYAQQIKALKRQQDDAFLLQQAARLKAQEEAELAQLQKAKRKALEQRDAQMRQLDDLKARILAEREASRVEGDCIRQQAMEEAEELKQKEAAMRARAKQANLETKKANEILLAFKKLDAQRELEADAAIAAYAAKKAELAEERKRREAEREAAKEARRQAMHDYMEHNFLQAKAASDARLARDIQEAEDRAEANAAEEARLRQEELESIDRSRKRQMEIKAAMAQARKSQEAQFAKDWLDRLNQLKAEEVAEAQARLEHNKQYIAFLQHQIDTKVARAARQKSQEDEEDASRRYMIQEDDETFQKYADVCIDEWRRQGKDTKPMELYMDTLEKYGNSVTRRI
ncbi:hypothetical protein WJX77_003574 [Trebouxia sp. C0004]